MRINDKKFISFLKSLKIKEDYIILHVKLINHRHLIQNIDNFWANLSKGLGNDKTFIVPTINLNFVRTKIWDKKKSQSKSGFFSEYFRKNISIRRTIHPIHSVSIFGKKYNKIPEHKSLSSFGKNSTWEWICKSKNVSNLSIGVAVKGGATFLHYIEEFLKVNYRFNKKITGNIRLKNKMVKKKIFYFARKRNKNFQIENNWLKCQNDLLHDKILKKNKFKNLNFFYMNTNKATNFIIKKMINNPNYLVKYSKLSRK